MKTIAHVVLVAAIASLGSIAMAQDSFGYGMAGCGLGTQIFENKPGKIPQIFQHITNKSASQTSLMPLPSCPSFQELPVFLFQYSI